MMKKKEGGRRTRTGIIRKAAAAVIAAALAASAGGVLQAANNPDVQSRNSGYYTTDAQEYPELAPIYEEAAKPDSVLSYEEKKRVCKEKEGGFVKVDGDGIFATCREYKTATYRVILTHVLVEDPSTQVKMGLSGDSFGGAREKTSSFAARTGAAVAVNGSYFYYETGKPIDVCAPVVLNEGEVLREGSSNGSEICLRSDGSFFSPHPSMPFSADALKNLGVISNLGTADPLLISDGTPQTYPNGGAAGGRYPRTALGVVWPGEYYLLTAGFDGSYEGGLSYLQMQSVFWHLGCTYARSFDGGGSATLAVNGSLVNLPAEGKEREVVDFLAFYPKGGRVEGGIVPETEGGIEARIGVLKGKTR